MTALKYWDGAAWQSIVGGQPLPAGGAVGAPLVKNSAADYDAQWAPLSGTIVSEQARAVMGGYGTTNSTAFVVISGTYIPQVNFVKRYAGTLLEFAIGGSAFITGAVGAVYFGCSYNNTVGTVVTTSTFFFNNLSQHQSFTGLASWSGLAAGTYPCTWWLRVGSAATTITNDANDLLWTRVKEIWP